MSLWFDIYDKVKDLNTVNFGLLILYQKVVKINQILYLLFKTFFIDMK